MMARTTTSDPLRRQFRDRGELEAYLRETFKDILARQPDGGRISATPGGREEADHLVRRVDPPGYKVSRNHLRGKVTRLSPYIRHGVVSLAHVRDAVLASVHRPDQAEKLINELGWRDYWQRVYARVGDQVWEDQENYKTGFRPEDYKDDLPAEISEGRSGLACMDAFANELAETGYLHNHARMWVAAYIVHWLKIRWQIGARWFLRHLLDGDPASNNLSWQWVASTFSAKPYIFNRENLERFTDNRFCPRCPRRDDCPFDATYEELTARLFREIPADLREDERRGGHSGDRRGPPRGGPPRGARDGRRDRGDQRGDHRGGGRGRDQSGSRDGGRGGKSGGGKPGGRTNGNRGPGGRS